MPGVLMGQIRKIISGGQTGVDRAALDFALEWGIPCGGYCPKGRLAEDGPIADRYPLTEMPTTDYADRTRKNVEISDGTLILHRGPLHGGTGVTAGACRKLKKPLFLIDVDHPVDHAAFDRWAHQCGIRVLNVAGPRASHAPSIYGAARKALSSVLRRAR